MKKRNYKIRPANRIFIIWLFVVLVLFAGIAVFSSYIAQKRNVMLQCEIVMQDVFELYSEKVYHFSDIYVPIFASEDNESVMRSYFGRKGEEIPDATQRAKLVALLGEMMRKDSTVSFIALYNPDAQHNYCFVINGNSLTELWSDLPVGESKNKTRMQLLGRYEWRDAGGNPQNAFLIRGGVPEGAGNGCIIVGYQADIFEQVIGSGWKQTPASYLLTNENGVIYDSEGIRYAQEYPTDWLGQEAAFHKAPDGRLYFTGVIRNSGRFFTAAYMIPWWRLAKECHEVTWLILVILVCFTCFVLALYMYSARQIFRKVEQIQSGLTIIGSNRLDYRLQVTGSNDEFDEIADNINRMTGRLKDSIENEYQIRIRQTRAELSQIQTRFNPHFLYNMLEIVKGNLYQNGDMENADYIEKLSRIFRNLTDAEPVLSIREEVSFCNLYMALLQMRFHDAVDITYDMDPALLDLGILAHLLQPAIENYFMHAMSESTEYHTMEISCEQISDNGIRFVIADNGTGLSPERLEEINLQLKNPVKGKRGYGLISIANRIRLFYGAEYGIMLEHNQTCGIRVIIEIPQMSVKEHQHKLGIWETDGEAKNSERNGANL